MNLFWIPASRQYDEDWNCTSKRLEFHCLFIPASRQYDEDWNIFLLATFFGFLIPASRQYDEDWNFL